MITILQQLFVLYVFLFLGWLFGKLKKGEIAHTELLSFLLVNLFLPAKVFGTFGKNFTVSYIQNNYVMLLISVAFLIGLAALSVPVSVWLTKKPYEQKIYRYTLTVSNYAYLGYVLMEELFGATGLANLILFCIPFVLYTYSFGYMMLTGKKQAWKRLLNPMTASILFGMVFGLLQIPLPAMVEQVISSASSCVGPISMLLTGLTLATFSLRQLLCEKNAYIVSAIRLVLLPLLVFGICKLFAWDAFVPYAVFVSCMPCGLNTIVFPKLIGEDCQTGARLAFLSHLFSLITIPLFLSLVSAV